MAESRVIAPSRVAMAVPGMDIGFAMAESRFTTDGFAIADSRDRVVGRVIVTGRGIAESRDIAGAIAMPEVDMCASWCSFI